MLEHLLRELIHHARAHECGKAHAAQLRGLLRALSENLDFNSQREMIKIFDELKKRGKAVVIISHNEHTLDCCDKFYSLENGKIIEQE